MAPNAPNLSNATAPRAAVVTSFADQRDQERARTRGSIVAWLGRTSLLRLALLTVLVSLEPSLPAQTVAASQLPEAPQPQPAIIHGTVLGVDNDVVAGSTVVLNGPIAADRRTLVASKDGLYEFDDVKPGGPYQITISANGFAGWSSPLFALQPAEYKIVTNSKLHLAAVQISINVFPPEVIAARQLNAELKQRVLGIIPDFYTVYGPNAEPLTTKLKFKLALRTMIDPVTINGVALYSGIQQAADTPDYGQGAQGYGKRLGATAADGATDIMIGGAILPSVLHQDPRYFCQCAGTTRSRILHALSYPFVAKGDNGKLQPNYSSIGGSLASSAISNAYYPASNRGAGSTFQNFAIGTGERMAAALVREFLLRKLTHNIANPER